MTRASTPSGLQGVERLGEEEIVQGEPLALVLELDVGEGHVADHRVDAALGKPGVAEVLDADVRLRVEGPGDAAGDGVQLDADEPHTLRGLAMKLPGAAPRLKHGAHRPARRGGPGPRAWPE